MQGVEIMVATPGRLLDLVQGNALKLGQVEFLVLDEADRMLDMGFINDIKKIVAKLPVRRQTLFFSATMPKDIAELAEAMLRDPARVAVTPVSSTVERIAQRLIQLDHSAKPAMLAQLLKQEPLCRLCLAKGRVTPATIADHVIPIAKDGAVHDINNLQRSSTDFQWDWHYFKRGHSN